MAERTKLSSYMTFSTINTLVYCFPAHWMWGKNGWLATLGTIDIAGAGPVHLVGGTTGLVATLILKPRHKRYQKSAHPDMGSPTNALLGTFMLWWGWLGFNCGSTFGISGNKWILAARSAVSTLIASISGGALGCIVSYITKKRQFDISMLINSLLGSLVGITGFCALAAPWESFIIGTIGAGIALSSVEALDRLEIDDPVGSVGVHMCSSIWSLLVAGLFAKPDKARGDVVSSKYYGVFYGGGWYLLGVQALAVVSIIVWTVVTTTVLLLIIDKTMGLRVSVEEEIMGADLVEHGIGLHSNVLLDVRGKNKISSGDRNETEGESNVDAVCQDNASANEVMTMNGLVQGHRSSYPGIYHPEIQIVERRRSLVYGTRKRTRLEYPVSRLERALAIEERLQPMIKNYVAKDAGPTSASCSEEPISEETSATGCSNATSHDVILDVTALEQEEASRGQNNVPPYGSSNPGYQPDDRVVDKSPDSSGKIKGL